MSAIMYECENCEIFVGNGNRTRNHARDFPDHKYTEFHNRVGKEPDIRSGISAEYFLGNILGSGDTLRLSLREVLVLFQSEIRKKDEEINKLTQRLSEMELKNDKLTELSEIIAENNGSFARDLRVFAIFLDEMMTHISTG